MLGSSNNVAVDVRDLYVKYNDYVALEDISFRIRHPSITVIMGPNGAGKTTLVKSILKLIDFHHGEIRVFGLDVKEHEKEIRNLIGYVPQREKVTEHIPIRARDVVLLAKMVRIGPLAIPTRRDIIEVKEALKKVLLPRDAWNKRFSELSGGQKQKVLIARAIVLKPKLLILDEPFSGVDTVSQREIMDFLSGLKKKGISIIIVAHDINPIVEYVDNILLLNRKMIAFGKPKEVLTEENLSKAYGIDVRVIVHGEACYAIIGDRHA